MRINHEDPRTPSASEAAQDAAIDASLPAHDCGTCEWCVAVADALAKMIPSNAKAPF